MRTFAKAVAAGFIGTMASFVSAMEMQPIASAPANYPAVSRYWNLRQTPITDVVRKVKGAVVNIQSEKPSHVDEYSILGSSKN
ncbi:MAG: hypothetical protein ACO3E9_07035 [Gemmataceae bacterium]